MRLSTTGSSRVVGPYLRSVAREFRAPAASPGLYAITIARSGRSVCSLREQIEYVRLGARVYLRRRRPSFAQAYSVVERRIARDNARRPPQQRVTCPSKDAICRAVHGLSVFAVYAARHGADEAKKKFILTSQGLDVVRPGQRVEIDHYEVDLEAILKREKLWEFLRGDQQASVQRMQLCMALGTSDRTAP